MKVTDELNAGYNHDDKSSRVNNSRSSKNVNKMGRNATQTAKTDSRKNCNNTNIGAAYLGDPREETFKLREENISLREENLMLKEKIKELIQKQEAEDDIERHVGGFLSKKSEAGKGIYYCGACFGDRKVIQLVPDDTASWLSCPKCGYSYQKGFNGGRPFAECGSDNNFNSFN